MIQIDEISTFKMSNRISKLLHTPQLLCVNKWIYFLDINLIEGVFAVWTWSGWNCTIARLDAGFLLHLLFCSAALVMVSVIFFISVHWMMGAIVMDDEWWYGVGGRWWVVDDGAGCRVPRMRVMGDHGRAGWVLPGRLSGSRRWLRR